MDHFLQVFKHHSFKMLYFRTAMLLMIAVGWYVSRDIVDRHELLDAIVRLLFFYFFLNIFFNLIRISILFIYKHRLKRPFDHVDNFTIGISKLSFFLNHFIFLLIFIDTVFIDLQTLLTSITIGLMFIAVVFRDYITNFLNGVIIMFSGNFRLGEYVMIGDHKGKVSNLTFWNVELLTDTKDIVQIPNNTVASKETTNFSRSKIKTIVVELALDEKYYPHYKKIEKKIRTRIPRQFKDVVTEDKNIVIRYGEISSDHMRFAVEYHVARYNFKLELEMQNYTKALVLDYINAVEEKKVQEKEKEVEVK